MPTEHVKNKEMQDAVTDMLGELSYTEFNPIRETEVKIEVCQCVRTDKDGNNAKPKTDPIALKKVGAVERPFLDADYILVIDNSAWELANETQQQAIIHRGLMKINIEVGEGKIKIGTRKPNLVEFTETITRFGTYNETLLTMKEVITLTSKQVARKMQIEKV